MKIGILGLAAGLMFASCPKPTPTDPGYDCANQPTFKRGEVVKVANAIAGRYIVRLKDRSNRMQPLMAVQGVTQVQTIQQGYAAQIATQALARILADPNVEAVFQDGLKSIRPFGPEPRLSVARAGSTFHRDSGPVAVLDRAEVVRRPCVTVPAERLALWYEPMMVRGMLTGVNESEMFDVDARPCLADVVEVQAGWYARSMDDDPRGAVGIDSLIALDAEAPIAVSTEAARPQGAAILAHWTDVPQEALRGRRHSYLASFVPGDQPRPERAGVGMVGHSGSVLTSQANVQWNLDRVDQRSLPLDGIYDPGADGNGVNVAVIDTGISPHPDYGDRLQAECFTAVGGGCADGHNHGTHVAGTVAGQTYGIAKRAKLYAVRVLDDNGSGSDSGVIRGIEWVTAKKQANPGESWVINMSLGGSDSPPLNEATCSAIAAGVTVVVAAGNENSDADTSSPARVKQAVTVGASTEGDARASFSNYGTLLDIFAPGQDIKSTQPGGGTATFSGTSMASPHTAGAAALYLQRHLGASPAAVRDGLVTAASVDKLSGVGIGSPNLLLYVKEE